MDLINRRIGLDPEYRLTGFPRFALLGLLIVASWVFVLSLAGVAWWVVSIF